MERTVKITSTNKLNFPSFQMDIINADININFPGIFMGCDPGTVHTGVATISNRKATLYEITTERQETTPERIKLIWGILNRINVDPIRFIIEGASYGDRFRQVELQDVRAGVATWMLNRMRSPYEIEIVPPRTIRKVVFGSGKIKNPWEDIPDNAAAALACALYPLMKGKEK